VPKGRLNSDREIEVRMPDETLKKMTIREIHEYSKSRGEVSLHTIIRRISHGYNGLNKLTEPAVDAQKRLRKSISPFNRFKES
jgi:hypothetical protein